jgi:hypothetical protein
LATGTPLLAADGTRVQLSPSGQGLISEVSGKRLYGVHGQPLSLMRHHKSRQERVAAVLAVLQKATDQVGGTPLLLLLLVLLLFPLVDRSGSVVHCGPAQPKD